jgi:hypothetical protein
VNVVGEALTSDACGGRIFFGILASKRRLTRLSLRRDIGPGQFAPDVYSLDAAGSEFFTVQAVNADEHPSRPSSSRQPHNSPVG